MIKIMIVFFMIIPNTAEQRILYKYPYHGGITIEDCYAHILGHDNRLTLITEEAIVGVTCVEEK